MLPILLLLAAFAGLHAQTALDATQTRTAPGEWRVFAFDPAGKPVLLKLGVGVVIDAAAGTISAAAQAPIVSLETIRHKLTQAPDGSYPLACTSGGVVHRNGLAMFAGLDYDMTASAMIPREKWAPSDVVTCHLVRVSSLSLTR